MSDPVDPRAIPINDVFSPILGPTSYLPPQAGEGFDNPLQTIGSEFANTGTGIYKTFQGLRALEALGLARLGRVNPTVQEMMGYGVDAAAQMPFYIPGLSNPDLQAAIHANPATKNQFRSPIETSDLPYIGGALMSIVKQPMDDYIRPLLAGHMEAPLTNFARDPFTAGTNIAAGGAIAKSMGGGKLAKAVGVPALKSAAYNAGDKMLRGSISKTVNAFKQAVDEAPLNQANSFMKEILDDAPAEMQNAFRQRRAELTKKWDAVPDDVKPAVAPAQGLTDDAAVQATKASPEAQEFLNAANSAEAASYSSALRRGLVDDTNHLLTRVGPQYMAAVRSGKYPAPVVFGRKEPIRNLQAKDLLEPEVFEELKEFAGNQKKWGNYTPLVSEMEAQAHIRQPVKQSLFVKKAGEVGAFKERSGAYVGRSDAGYLTLKSGHETGNLADAFITRLEQLDRAVALYDWAENFGETFANLPPRVQKLIAQRFDNVLDQAFKSAGLPQRQVKLTAMIEQVKQIGPESFIEKIEESGQFLMDYLKGRTPGVAEHMGAFMDQGGSLLGGLAPKKVASAQRISSILPDFWYPLYMAAQQAMSFGSHAFSGPRPFTRSLIAAYLVSNRRIAKLIVPVDVVEHSRVFNPKWAHQNPLADKFLKLSARAVHTASQFQDKATKAINAVREAAAVTHMLQEFEHLPDAAQKYVLKGMAQQLNFEKLILNLAKQKRALEGGFTHRTRLDAGPIFKKLKETGTRRRYRKAAIKKAVKRYNDITDAIVKDGANMAPAEIARLEARQEKLIAQVEKYTGEIGAIEADRAAFMQGKKPITIVRPSISGPGVYKGAAPTPPPYMKKTITKEYVQEKQMGLQGMTQKEAQKALDELVNFVNDFYGDYSKRHIGAADDLNTTILWLNMTLHAIRMGKTLHTKFALVGDSVEQMARFAREEERKHAELKALPPWAQHLGVWESDKYSPEGTRTVYGARGWLMGTASLALPTQVQSALFPDSVGIQSEFSDLNMYIKAAFLFSGQKPGSDRDIRNPEYYQVGEHYYKPATLAARITRGQAPDLLDDAVQTTWPNIVHEIFQGFGEASSEKWWSQAKTWNKLITIMTDPAHKGAEPSDMTIPLNPFAQYPKRSNGPFGPVQPASPMNVTSVLPGGSKFASFTFNQNNRADRFEMQQRKALIRKAAEAAANLNPSDTTGGVKTTRRRKFKRARDLQR